MKPKKYLMYGLAALVCVVLAVSTGLSAVPGTTDTPVLNPQTETGLGPAPFYNLKARGADFIKVGVTTRVFNILTAPSQSEPFVLTVPPLPPGAVVEKVFICWNYLLSGVPPATEAITANGFPVVGSLCGSGSPDLCWGRGGGASYKADATGIIIPALVSVPVTIAGATDKPLGTDPMAYGEGLSILVVYKVASAPCRNVDVWCGYTSNQSGGGPASAILTYTIPYTGGDFHFFTNALDGQIAGDDFFINGGLFVVEQLAELWQLVTRGRACLAHLQAALIICTTTPMVTFPASHRVRRA